MKYLRDQELNFLWICFGQGSHRGKLRCRVQEEREGWCLCVKRKSRGEESAGKIVWRRIGQICQSWREGKKEKVRE